jgi:hypothetical protein
LLRIFQSITPADRAAFVRPSNHSGPDKSFDWDQVCSEPRSVLDGWQARAQALSRRIEDIGAAFVVKDEQRAKT